MANIIKSRYPEANIAHESVTFPEFVLKQFEEYGDKVALVSFFYQSGEILPYLKNFLNFCRYLQSPTNRTLFLSLSSSVAEWPLVSIKMRVCEGKMSLARAWPITSNWSQ